MAKDKSSTTSTPPSPLSTTPQDEVQQYNYKPRKAHPPEAAASPVRPEREPEDINESADAFIRRFRQQLQLQRLESMEDYRQMLARGL